MREYFSHDLNARNDRKLVKLAMKKGLAGVGLYWCIVEMLHESGGLIENKEIERIAFELRVDTQEVVEIIYDFDLFVNDGVSFWSESALKRIEKQKDVRDSRVKAAQQRWAKNADAMQMDSKSNAIKEKESKVKERKEKESIVLDTGLPAVIQISEKEKFEDKVVLYCLNNGIHEKLAQEFTNYWTERNQKGKMKWQLEKTFEIPNRIATWRRNAEKMGYPKNGEYLKKNSVAAMKDNYQQTMNLINNSDEL